MTSRGFYLALPALFVLVLLGACGGDEGVGDIPADPECTSAPEGDNTFVFDTLVVPESANEALSLYGLDIDGKANDTSNGIDNAMGQSFASLALFGIDVATPVTAAIDQGDLIVLANLRASDLTTAACADVSLYIGEQPDPAPCSSDTDTECRLHLQGGASFSIAADAPTDTVVPGRIIAGAFAARDDAEPTNITLELPLLEDMPPLEFNLIGAQVAIGSVNETGLSSGILAGAIKVSEIEQTLIPALQLFVTALLATDCTGTFPDCCTAGSGGATALSFFDTDDDCAVSEEEITNNTFIGLLLDPDVDLLDADGNYAPNTDGEDDSLSLGLGFSATTANFTLP